jgi:putative tricarboxylic transport membrane protein
MQKRIGVVFSLFFFAFCLFFWWQVTLLPPDDVGQEGVGMGLFPIFCIVMIAALSLVLLVRSLVFPLMDKEIPDKISRSGQIRIAVVLALMLAYALGYEWVGFYIGTYLFALASLFALGERRPLVVILFPPCMVLCVYLGFVQVLNVLLPEGELLHAVLS